MKKTISQYVISPIILFTTVIIMGYTSTALAIKVNGSLGTKATAVDLYRSTCIRDASGVTGQFFARVEAITKGPLVSVKVKKGIKSVKTTDPKNADKIPGPNAILKGAGDGVYDISVDKRGLGIVNYVLQTHCRTAAGKKTNQVGPKLIQNQ